MVTVDAIEPLSDQDTECVSASESSDDKFPEALAGHESYFALCKHAIKQRCGDADTNNELLSELQKLSELLAKKNMGIAKELEAAETEYNSKLKLVEYSKQALTNTQINFDHLATRIAKRIETRIQAGKQNDWHMYENILLQLTDAYNNRCKAEEEVKARRSNLDNTKAKCDAVKARCESDELVANARSVIEKNLTAGSFTWN